LEAELRQKHDTLTINNINKTAWGHASSGTVLAEHMEALSSKSSTTKIFIIL
jgi:hypothetical protein